jgi:hypothetical protein
MTDSDIQKIIRDVGDFQAEYIPLPISSKPVGCAIPDLLAGSIDLPDLDAPNISKTCIPTFTQFPIVPEPFTIPETCPNGITFNEKNVLIFPSLTSINPAGSVIVSVDKNPDDLCSFDLNLPDIVIPCFPTGPQLYSTAQVTVVDPNAGTNVSTPLDLVQDAAVACRWGLSGDVTITLPEVPCPNGFQFSPGIMKITSTCAHIIENKPFEITRNQSNPCLFDVSIPALKIPCYPNGPQLSSDLVINVHDPLDSSNADIHMPVTLGPLPNKCCDFKLSGPVTIPVPCRGGVKFPIQPITVIQPSWLDVHGNDITPTLTQPPLSIQGVPVGNDCTIGIHIPPIKIPCYPDGIKFTGAVQFRTADGVTIPDTIDLSNDGDLRNRTKPCQWDIGTTIDLPTDYCPGGFTYGYDDRFPFRIFINDNTEVPYYTDPGRDGALDDPDAPDYPNSGQVAVPNRWHNWTLMRRPADGLNTNCGAILAGELHLGLAAFTYNCTRLTVGSKNTVNIFLNDPQKLHPYPIQLQNTASGCGFEFSTPELQLPVLSCPDGFKVSTDSIQVFMGTSQTPLQHTIALSPITPGFPACGLKLSGTLRIPSTGGGGGGFGGFSFAPWSPDDDYGPGDSTGIVYPEGARCVFNATGNATSLNVPGTPSGEDVWANVGCSGNKQFAPYTVIRCTELPTTPTGVTIRDEDKKSLVKVVPRSFLYKNLKDKGLEFIHGLNTPFLLGPSEQVWLELVIDGTGQDPVVVYSAICKGATWDADYTSGATVPGVGDQQYKVIRKADAVVLTDIDFASVSTDKIVGIKDDVKLDLKNKFQAVLGNMQQLNDTRPRQIKAYVLIANATAGEDVSNTTTKPVRRIDGLVLQQGTSQYVVHQVLDCHLVEKGHNADNVPIIIPEKVPGAKGPTDKLTAPDITTIIDTDPITNKKTVTVTFAIAPVTQGTKTFNLGTTSTDIQIYYTTDGSVPTINTGENKKCFKFVPNANGVIKIAEDDMSWGLTWGAWCVGFEYSDPASKKKHDIDPVTWP